MVSEGMLPRAAVKEVEARLTAAGCLDADFDARELFRLATGRDVRLSDRPLDAAEAAKLEELTVRRAAREPLQYLCGSWPFLDFELAVGPGVLCPRADTEVVAETAAEMLAGVEAPRVLDLCAGTGCLGLGVKRLCPAAQVVCVEKSPEAYIYLEKNTRLALKGRGGSTENVLDASPFEEPAFDWGMKPTRAAEPVEGDLFTYWETLPEGQLDLIVSNPPYLTAQEMGELQARVLGAALGVPVLPFSHQQGHIAASLWGSGHMELMDEPHLAWHLSGGTTELLRVTPEGKGSVHAERIGGTTDISAGQLIDRTGKLLGLPFPSGKPIDALSRSAQDRQVFRVKVQGTTFSLSGVQNKVEQYHAAGNSPEETAGYALRCLIGAIVRATENALLEYPGSSVVFAGGVASNTLLRSSCAALPAVFCPPQFATDNALGVAVLTWRALHG